MSMCTFFVFFKQKTAYEMRISDWSSDVCSSDLREIERGEVCISQHLVPHIRKPLPWLAGSVRGHRRYALDAGIEIHLWRVGTGAHRHVHRMIHFLHAAHVHPHVLHGSKWQLDRKSTRLNSSH